MTNSWMPGINAELARIGGDLFVVRTVGHVLGAEVLGSIEYGTSVLDCRLVVVLGHDSCGAVAAARTTGSTTDSDFIDAHIQHTVDLLLERSRILADQVASGRTGVVGLAYRLAEGNARLVTAHGIPTTTDTPSP
ncbi:carbonic anhydrase [Streptomyces sp. 2132.2]|uniref:carbonic anhydrase n=1 Tax=Streptomyces sp. 2132.2 TaxID=2485161 RepID=UPI001614B223|nr:carbonic anhydrase [Streptomyces sp. 2132.2]